MFDVTLSRLEITIPPCDRHNLRLIYQDQVETVQLQLEGLTLRETASRLKVLADVVHKRHWRSTEYSGYTDPPKKRIGWPKILDGDDELYLKSLSESNPSIYLDEIKEKLEAIHGVSVSMATISHFLRSQDFILKILT